MVPATASSLGCLRSARTRTRGGVASAWKKRSAAARRGDCRVRMCFTAGAFRNGSISMLFHGTLQTLGAILTKTVFFLIIIRLY